MAKIFYILDADKRPVPVSPDDYLAWRLSNDDNIRVAFTEIAHGISVSTVFLGLDHSFGFRSVPILFETMIFDGTDQAHNLDLVRYCLWEEAVAGHEAVVQEVTARVIARIRA